MDNYPAKSRNLRHCQARSQNKGLSGASPLRTSPFPAGDREGSQSRKGAIGPREASDIKLQADFSGLWAVDIHREGCRQRSAPQDRHTAHLRRRASCSPRKPSGWDGGGDKTQPSIGGDSTRQAPGHLSRSDLGRAQNAGRTESAPLGSTREPGPEWLRPGKGM